MARNSPSWLIVIKSPALKYTVGFILYYNYNRITTPASSLLSYLFPFPFLIIFLPLADPFPSTQPTDVGQMLKL